MDAADCLAAAIEQGLTRPPAALSRSTTPSSRELDPFADVPADRLDGVHQCRSLRGQALRCATCGDLDEARRLIGEARALVETLALPRAAELRETAHEAGALAYIAYREGNLGLVEEILRAGCEADAEAAAIFGALDAEGHRIRLTVNLVRARRRCGDPMGAVVCATQVLDRIGGCPTALLSERFTLIDPRDLAQLGLGFLELQAIEEIAEAVHSTVHADRERLMAPVGAHMATWGCNRDDLGHCFLRGALAEANDDPTGVLEAAISIFARGPRASRVLWRVTVAFVDQLVMCGYVAIGEGLERQLAAARSCSVRVDVTPGT